MVKELYTLLRRQLEKTKKNQSLIVMMSLSVWILDELRERTFLEDNIFVGEYIRSWIKSIKERRRNSSRTFS